MPKGRSSLHYHCYSLEFCNYMFAYYGIFAHECTYCVCMHDCLFMCVGIYVWVCMWRPKAGAVCFPQWFCKCYQGRACWQISNSSCSSWPACFRDPSCKPPWCWVVPTPAQVLNGFCGSKLSLHLCSKCITHWDLSPVLIYFNNLMTECWSPPVWRHTRPAIILILTISKTILTLHILNKHPLSK